MIEENFNKDDILYRIRISSDERERVAAEMLHHKKLCNGIEKVVRSKGGNKDDVRHILHMTIVSFFKKVLTDRSFDLQTNIYSYLNGVAKYLWYGELRKKSKEVSIEDLNVFNPSTAPSHDLIIMDKEKRDTLHKVLRYVGDKCKDVLMMWASGHNMKEIAAHMGYNNEGAVRKKKYDCMKTLVKILEENPQIKKRLE